MTATTPLMELAKNVGYLGVMQHSEVRPDVSTAIKLVSQRQKVGRGLASNPMRLLSIRGERLVSEKGDHRIHPAWTIDVDGHDVLDALLETRNRYLAESD
ncbi:hypothetical protein Vadar_006331 [Vaccinium darrowii]|uniref:Uncharacterized protein n=1 Tax=Vaccinium darrowii TaxID=229202 RepID=A0ACB7X8K9_9ERIC|nr:hypothetical protein Vadar_006331 [Vaccinium darrowii]